MRTIELLSPARDADTGIEAVLHGADAVYIGGPAFSARAAAGNDIADIERLCRFAHLYGARIYVTLNTILRDDELSEARSMVQRLYDAGVDALIIQDLALLRLDLPPIALHASTQMDNRTPDDARRLEAMGFSQIVVARELSLTQIREFSAATSCPVEAFVHGALCVSYSGRCYASQYCFGRSANRGRCAQFCRLGFDLVDADGQVIQHDKHLLSLRDMNRMASLEAMMDAGVSSFKIEGRLKDTDYVKNVTAAYRRAIDDILVRRSADYRRSSYGATTLTFEPNVEKSFNRGFTEYFLHDTRTPMHSFDTPKAKGEAVGRVARVTRRSFTIENPLVNDLQAGDGLCYLGTDGRLQGFRVNRIEADGSIFPATMPRLRPGTPLFRNHSQAFDRALSRPTAERRIDVDLRLTESETGYRLSISDESGLCAEGDFVAEHAAARTPQRAAVTALLARLGDTPFRAVHVDIDWKGERFIPSSQLAAWRREVTESLIARRYAAHRREKRRPFRPEDAPPLTAASLNYSANLLNREAKACVTALGAANAPSALEAFPIGTRPEGPLMTCRYCLLHALGYCTQTGRKAPWRMPLILRLPDGRRFPLRFDCKHCQMCVYAPTD